MRQWKIYGERVRSKSACVMTVEEYVIREPVH